MKLNSSIILFTLLISFSTKAQNTFELYGEYLTDYAELFLYSEKNDTSVTAENNNVSILFNNKDATFKFDIPIKYMKTILQLISTLSAH